MVWIALQKNDVVFEQIWENSLKIARANQRTSDWMVLKLKQEENFYYLNN